MLKRFILWDYKRGSWQYDVMVGIILLFIFLTPRQFFGDGPRLPQTKGIAMLPAENGGWAFFVDPKQLGEKPDSQRKRDEKLTDLVQNASSDRRLRVTRVEPVLDSDGELLTYMVFARH
jgi:hypothetical protein